MNWWKLPKENWCDYPVGKYQRDNQRSRLYKAEEVLETLSKKIPSIHDIRKWVTAITKTKWFKERWFRSYMQGIKVKDGRGTSWAKGCTSGWINLPKWARKEHIILHEIAHVLVLYGHGASHGRRYARTYLSLVKHVMGEEAHDLLAESFDENKVEYHPYIVETV